MARFVRAFLVYTAGMDNPLDRILTAAWEPVLLRNKTVKVVLAVSGGRDSLSLMHWCAHTALIPNHRLIVVHIDHLLRPDSRKDSEAVAQLADAWGIKCRVIQADVAAFARETKRSIEDAGRHTRYRILSEVAQSEGCQLIVTGHHADDQAETVLLHLLRGAGPQGLQGMLPMAPVPGGFIEDVSLFRPMLHVTRADIDAYVALHQLAPLEDESNQDPRFLRNRIRHELIPLLQTYNPRIQSGLAQMTSLVQADVEALQAYYEQIWKVVCLDLNLDAALIRLDFDGWQKELIGAQRHVLRQSVLELSGSLLNISFEVIEQARLALLRSETGLVVDLGHGIQAARSYQEIVITDGRFPISSILSRWPQLPLAEDGTISRIDLGMACDSEVAVQMGLADGWQILIEPASQEYLEPLAHTLKDEPTSLSTTLALCPESVLSLCLRPRVEGERFIPFRFEGTVKLKKLMIDRKIPAAARARFPIVADDQGILWIPGIRLAERAAVKENQDLTRNYKITFQRLL